jgi:hypothetical protein
MNNLRLIVFCLLTVGLSHAQSITHAPLHFDLSKIGDAFQGQQICEDKGRLQDYPSKEMDRIMAAGPRSVPVLIEMITDARMAKTKEPIICFWPGMAIGDIAFCALSDLFTDARDKGTMPGTGWNDLLGYGDNVPGWEQLGGYISKHGRTELRAKWQEIWNKNRDQIYWDARDRCFRLKAK